MKRKTDTEIEFSGLKSGVYDFDFDLGKDFFEPYENDKLSAGEVTFHVKMEKTEHLMMLYLSFSGEVKTVCDRCLGPLTLSVSGEETVNVKFSDTAVSESYDDIVLPTNAYKIDLAQQFYEMVAVSVPLRCVHPDDENGVPTCDPEMLSYLSEESGEETDSENEPSGDECDDETDPRWQALKALRDKDETKKV